MSAVQQLKPQLPAFVSIPTRRRQSDSALSIRESIRRLSAEGKKPRQIAELVNRVTSTVNKHLAKLNDPKEPNTWTPAELKIIQEFCDNNQTAEDALAFLPGRTLRGTKAKANRMGYRFAAVQCDTTRNRKKASHLESPVREAFPTDAGFPGSKKHYLRIAPPMPVKTPIEIAEDEAVRWMRSRGFVILRPFKTLYRVDRFTVPVDNIVEFANKRRDRMNLAPIKILAA